MATSTRAAEIIEAVTLLADLNKPLSLICSQLDISEVEARAIITTGKLPRRQLELFQEPGGLAPVAGVLVESVFQEQVK